jgi:hypothetical protein
VEELNFSLKMEAGNDETFLRIQFAPVPSTIAI